MARRTSEASATGREWEGARQAGEQKEFLIGSICDANSLAEKVEVHPSLSLSVYRVLSCDGPKKKVSQPFDLGMEHDNISLQCHSIKGRAVYLFNLKRGQVLVWCGGGAAQSFSPSDKFPEVQQSKDNPSRKGLYYLINCRWAWYHSHSKFQGYSGLMWMSKEKKTEEDILARFPRTPPPLYPPPPRGPVGLLWQLPHSVFSRSSQSTRPETPNQVRSTSSTKHEVCLWVTATWLTTRTPSRSLLFMGGERQNWRIDLRRWRSCRGCIDFSLSH